MKLKKTLAALAVGAALVVVAPTAAHASEGGWLCSTRDATPVYAYSDFTAWLFTLSPGRGFRVHVAEGIDATWIKFKGHGAERPDRDGWVRAHHISC